MFVLVGKFLKKLEYLGPDSRCAERMHSNKRRHRLKCVLHQMPCNICVELFTL